MMVVYYIDEEGGEERREGGRGLRVLVVAEFYVNGRSSLDKSCDVRAIHSV